jgi:dolichyl-phosphate-mannose--protein O-mannosyl transferase
MFGGIAVPACTTAVFAFDFMHFVQTRIATIDTYGVFFIILMYLFMYLYISGSRDGEEKLLYLFLSGLCFGIGAACKWTCLYAGAGLAVIWAIFRVSRRKDGFTAFAANCLWCVLFFVIIPALIYYLSYFPYGLARGMTFPGMYFSREYFNIVTDNQKYMFNYHSGLVAEHPYSSVWYQWIFDIRPILYYLEYYDDGTRSVFGAFTNPALTWLGVITMIMTLVISIIHRDNKGIFIIIGYLAQLLPWVFITRLTFAYHYFPSMVFLSLSVGYIFNAMRLSVKNWRIPVYGYTALCIAVFILFYPVLSGARTDGSRISYFLGWLETWPF